MPYYTLREILLFAIAGLVAALLLPGGFWPWMLAAVAAYALLALFSEYAFEVAVKTGAVSRSRENATEFFIHPKCPSRWFVRRYIYATPASRLNVRVRGTDRLR